VEIWHFLNVKNTSKQRWKQSQTEKQQLQLSSSFININIPKQSKKEKSQTSFNSNLPINTSVWRCTTWSNFATTENINGRIEPKYEEHRLNICKFTMTKNIKNGTMMILHYSLVN